MIMFSKEILWFGYLGIFQDLLNYLIEVTDDDIYNTINNKALGLPVSLDKVIISPLIYIILSLLVFLIYTTIFSISKLEN